MGRYTKEFWDSTPGLVETVITGGVINIVHDALNIPITFYCKITDTKSGASAVGKGATRGEASADAWFNLTGEKDERYRDNERNRKLNQEEFEKRNRERVQKQKEWEARKVERERKQKEWEARKVERELKQKEWEARKVERERKQKEWEARKAERERKQKEWEARKAERERKQKEWEARKAERERKQREWEARKVERERKQREWEARKAENERRRQEYLENKRYRSGGGHRGGGGRGKKGGDGCYITTATCLTLGKDDFCSELIAFRKYRDSWLAVNHPELIKEYYEVAPAIVDSIEKQENKIQIYKLIWENYLSLCLALIKAAEFEKAKEVYTLMVNMLKAIFLHVNNKTLLARSVLNFN